MTISHQEYENRLFNIESELYPIDKYVNSRTKIKHICIKDHITYVAPDSVLKGSRCTICSGYAKITDIEYLKELISIKCTFKPIEKYKSGKIQLKHRCMSCNYEVMKTRREMLEAPHCLNCSKPLILRPTLLYYIRIIKGNVIKYKIGISQASSFNKRYRREPNIKIEVLYKKLYDNKALAELAEQQILYDNKLFITKDIVLVNGGNNEVFDKDVSESIKHAYF